MEGDDYRKEAMGYRDDAWWSFRRLIVPGIVAITVVMVPLSCGLGWFTSAASVVSKQLDPSEVQRKYEWFKDASAALDAKQASIKVYESRLASMKDQYGASPRSKWARDDREQWNLWESEASGVRASYNELAADYNSQMAKWNWRFANRGELPSGATTPLPRDYKPYTEGQ